MTLTRKWALGTALLTVLILVAGWMLLIAPKRAEAAELRDAAAAQRSTNAASQIRLEELEAKALNLPAIRARLAAVRSRLPADAALPDLVRSLQDAAQDSGLDLRGVVPSVPELMTAAPTDPAAPVANSEQLYAIPVTVTLGGRYSGVSAFVNALEEMTRSFQVTGFTLGADGAQGGSSGAVALTVQGRVYVLSSTTPDVTMPAPTVPAPTVPAPTVPAPIVPTPAPPNAGQ